MIPEMISDTAGTHKNDNPESVVNKEESCRR